jgi:hypothetical protein
VEDEDEDEAIEVGRKIGEAVGLWVLGVWRVESGERHAER